jgi:hypothetical protein
MKHRFRLGNLGGNDLPQKIIGGVLTKPHQASGIFADRGNGARIGKSPVFGIKFEQGTRHRPQIVMSFHRARLVPLDPGGI